jgi:hypothetical protein
MAAGITEVMPQKTANKTVEKKQEETNETTESKPAKAKGDASPSKFNEYAQIFITK